MSNKAVTVRPASQLDSSRCNACCQEPAAIAIVTGASNITTTLVLGEKCRAALKEQL